MAKINLITQEITSSVFPTMEVLRSQQHEVVLWTASNDKVEIPTHLSSVFFPFKTWSLAEVILFCSQHLLSPGEVFHLIAGKEWGPKQTFLFLALQSIPQHSVLVTMTDDFLLSESSSVFFLLKNSKTLVFENYSSKLKAHQLCHRKKMQKWLVQAPLFQHTIHQTKKSSESENLYLTNENHPESLFDKIFEPENEVSVTPVIFTPLSKNSQRLIQLPQNFKTVFLLSENESLPDFDWKVLNFEILSTSAMPYFFQSCNEWEFSIINWIKNHPDQRVKAFIFLAGQELTTQQTTFWMQKALQYQIPVILDYEQAMTYSKLWQPGKNCLLFSKVQLDLDWACTMDKIKECDFSLFAHHFESPSLDPYFNEVSRLYQGLFPNP